MKKNQKSLSVGFLYDDTLDSSDGVAQYIKTLGAWLSGQGHRVSYLVGETKMRQFAGGQVYSLSKNRRVVFNGNRLSMPMPTSRRAIEQVLSDNHFDVLHVQVPYSPFMAKQVIDTASDSAAIVGTFHIYPASFWADFGGRFLKLLLGDSLKRFDEMIAVSEPAARFALETFGLQSQIIPNTVDIDRFAKNKKKAAGSTKEIVFLGRLVERKGCLYLLKAFHQLLRSLPSVHLTIAGDGPQRAGLEHYAHRHKITGSVTFTGHISEQAKAQLLSSADIACFPSLYGESFGIVLIEAMAAGAQVVLGGNNPGYTSVLDGQKDLLVDPRDINHFSAHLQKLLTDGKLAEQLHKWQTAEVKHYDVNAVGPKILAVYQEAIAKRNKSSHN